MAPKGKANTERLSVFLSPDDAEKLREVAEQKRTSVSGMIRAIILEYLAKK